MMRQPVTPQALQPSPMHMDGCDLDAKDWMAGADIKSIHITYIACHCKQYEL